MSARLLACALLAMLASCAGADDDHHGDENLGDSSDPLNETSTVADAIAESCTTTAVRGLATQLVEEIQCMKPGSMKRIDGTEGLVLGGAVFPFLQTPAANALANVPRVRGLDLRVNSGLRTLPQQLLLYRWYRAGRCGIGLAAPPGTSNHESGIAVDIADNASWRSAMNSKGFAWLGSSDPVHFDYACGGTIDMRGLSVLAFQRLWNRNHAGDRIAEDGYYGQQTEMRLTRAPVAGFPVGAACAAAF